MPYQRSALIKHKEEKFRVYLKNEANICVHILKHLIEDKNEFWDEWDQDNKISEVKETLANWESRKCENKKREREKNMCKKCPKLEECFNKMYSKGLVKMYEDVIFKILETDWQEGPRHTHHVNNEEHRREMYYLGKNGVFIVLAVSNSSVCWVSAFRRYSKLGDIGIIFLEASEEDRYDYFRRQAVEYVDIRRFADPKGRVKITIDKWCTEENWRNE